MNDHRAWRGLLGARIDPLVRYGLEFDSSVIETPKLLPLVRSKACEVKPDSFVGQAEPLPTGKLSSSQGSVDFGLGFHHAMVVEPPPSMLMAVEHPACCMRIPKSCTVAPALASCRPSTVIRNRNRRSFESPKPVRGWRSLPLSRGTPFSRQSPKPLTATWIVERSAVEGTVSILSSPFRVINRKGSWLALKLRHRRRWRAHSDHRGLVDRMLTSAKRRRR